MRAARLIRTVVPAVVAATVLSAVGAGAAHAALPAQAITGKEVAAFIRTEWWPQASTEVGFPVPGLKKVRCPRSVPATTGEPVEVLSASLADLAAGRIAPTVDDTTGVFSCVAVLDGQRLLIGGAINEAGDARFATASLILDPAILTDVVAGEFETQVGGTADVVCTRRSLVVAQPDTPVRCTVRADDGSRGVADVVLDGNATIVSVEFAQK